MAQSLTAGATVGHYTILAPLGAGGMGEMYTATDTRLDRTVAIKVLPSELADDPARRARFEREAKAIAALSHPHICTLHEFDTQDGIDFLVMEYLEGETLAQRLTKGALPLDQALRYGIEIADALDKAHRQGITHRDLKPANIMLTKAGAKLLDFGLAKLKPLDTDVMATASRPTESAGLTGEGKILGTLQYMAPEQLEAKDVDARTDIFAFGAVLYEMLTGAKAFEGTSQASLIAAILEHDPRPLAELQPLTPPSLDRAVRRCLAKDPDGRWDGAHDLHDELVWIAEGGSAPHEAGVERHWWQRPVPLAVTLASLVGASVGGGVWTLRPEPALGPRAVARFSVTLPPGQAFTDTAYPPALSADGYSLVYAANRQLYLKARDQLEAVPLRGTQEGPPGPLMPFFSPDGQWVGYWTSDGYLKKVPVTGGPPVTVCEARIPSGASWGPDDTILFGQLGSDAAGQVMPGSIMQVAGSGGTPQPVVTVERDELAAFPQLLPGGEEVLFTSERFDGSVGNGSIVVQSLATGERRVLVASGFGGRLLPTGHLVYWRAGTLYAVAVDRDGLAPKGEPVPVVEGVAKLTRGGAPLFGVTDDGALVYMPSGAGEPARQLVWADRAGREELVEADVRLYAWPNVSPDGAALAVIATVEGNADVWLHDLARATDMRLTFHPGTDLAPLWTADGTRVVFASLREGGWGLYWKAANGAGEVERLRVSPNLMLPYAATPDGTQLLFGERRSEGGWDIDVLALAAQRVARPLLQTQFDESWAAVSPDGRWLAYQSTESGRPEVYVRPFPDVEAGKWQVSADGGAFPRWNPSGDELFYRAGATMLTVSVQTEPAFRAGTPTMLFEAQHVADEGHPYAVAPDGQQFLIVQAVGATQADRPPADLIIVENWTEELKRLVPTN